MRSWINDRRREAYDRRTIAGGKYPQLCRLGNQLVNICGDNLRLVIVERPFEESVKSLSRRCGSRHLAALRRHQRWLLNGRRQLEAMVAENHKLTVHYEDLLERPKQQARRLVDFLDLSCEDVDSQIAKAAALVNRQKRHVRL
jgi:hypothetical protein